MTQSRLRITGVLSVLVAAYASPCLATSNTLLTLQGTADAIDGFDDTHSGRAANFFQDGGTETGIYAIASDWASGHNPNANQPWPSSDGIPGWSYWDPAEDDIALRGPETLNANGERVYWDPVNTQYVFYATDAAASGSGHEKRYYLNNNRFVSTLSVGNNGTPASGTANRQHVVLSEYDLQSAYDEGFTGSELVSATFTIWIDDVINMDLISVDGQLSSQAFVNVYAGDGDLQNFPAIQSKFDTSDAGTAADTVDLVYDDIGLGEIPITDFTLARASVIGGLSRLQFDFDVTDEIAALLDQQAGFAGLTLAASDDGDFTLGSIDSNVADQGDGSILENYLPALTLEFAAALVPGDADGDGDVDDSDLGIAISNFTGPNGSGKTVADGDVDVDGDVDDSDLGVAISGFTGPLAASAVPEPTGLAVLTAGLFMLARRRRPQP